MGFNSGFKGLISCTQQYERNVLNNNIVNCYDYIALAEDESNRSMGHWKAALVV